MQEHAPYLHAEADLPDGKAVLLIGPAHQHGAFQRSMTSCQFQELSLSELVVWMHPTPGLALNVIHCIHGCCIYKGLVLQEA